MNVLSLFDGISCGQQALKELGVPVEKYYASETDKHAIAVTQKNFPDTIQLGDVTNWIEWIDVIDWSKIDLIHRINKRQNGQGFNDGQKFYTLTAQDRHGVLIEGYIRKLTPIECCRLQTLPDMYTDGISQPQ